MSDPPPCVPRWGSEGRDQKASAILQTLVSRLGNRVTEGTWADVGCGSGGIAAALALRVERVIGVDPEPWASWSTMQAENSNLSFIEASFDSNQLSLPDSSVDVVICNQVYEHVRYPERLIVNIHRILRPGGFCYFAGPNLLWPVEPHVLMPFVHWLPRPFAQKMLRAFGSSRSEELDAYSGSFLQLRSLFRLAGFEVENALHQRFTSGLACNNKPRLAALSAVLPRILFILGEPVSPGLVYLLKKPRDTIDDADG